MLRFSDLLARHMRFMKLEEVAEACRAQGVTLHPTYISKLRTGERPAPADECTVRALARAVGGDESTFLMVARLERNPHAVYAELLGLAFQALSEAGAMSTEAAIRLSGVVTSLGLQPVLPDADPIELAVPSESDPQDCIARLAETEGLPVDALRQMVQAMKTVVARGDALREY